MSSHRSKFPRAVRADRDPCRAGKRNDSGNKYTHPLPSTVGVLCTVPPDILRAPQALRVALVSPRAACLPLTRADDDCPVPGLPGATGLQHDVPLQLVRPGVQHGGALELHGKCSHQGHRQLLCLSQLPVGGGSLRLLSLQIFLGILFRSAARPAGTSADRPQVPCLTTSMYRWFVHRRYPASTTERQGMPM